MSPVLGIYTGTLALAGALSTSLANFITTTASNCGWGGGRGTKS